MSYHKFNIRKSHGGYEKFSQRKLYSSLKHSGLSHHKSQLIAKKVASEIEDGTRTKDIFRKTLQLVKRDSPYVAIHYSLKRAILDLGPTGHHFETFVARYFEALGFTTTTRQKFPGRFVSHEVDVVALKDKQRFFVECKFHNRVGIKNDVKIALYIKARWDDLRQGSEGKNLHGFYLASNTAFTQDALVYARGSGLKLLGVNAPEEETFLQAIQRLKLYPITCLKKLTKVILGQLLTRDIVLAREIPHNVKLLQRLGMSEEAIGALLDEVHMLEEANL